MFLEPGESSPLKRAPRFKGHGWALLFAGACALAGGLCSDARIPQGTGPVAAPEGPWPTAYPLQDWPLGIKPPLPPFWVEKGAAGDIGRRVSTIWRVLQPVPAPKVSPRVKFGARVAGIVASIAPAGGKVYLHPLPGCKRDQSWGACERL
jgi:hypothetical protein